MNIKDLIPVAVLFVAAGVTLAIGANITDSVRNTQIGNSTAWLAANNATSGITEISRWMPTIGLVVAASIIIGTIFFAMVGRG